MYRVVEAISKIASLDNPVTMMIGVIALFYKLVVIPVMEAIAFGGKPKHWSRVEELVKELYNEFFKYVLLQYIRLLIFRSLPSILNAYSEFVGTNLITATYVGSIWISTAIEVGIKTLEAVEEGTEKAVEAGTKSCIKYSSSR